MSSYIFMAKDKKTGAKKEVFAMDDYFGRHLYGFSIDSDILTEWEFDERFEPIRDDLKKKKK